MNRLLANEMKTTDVAHMCAVFESTRDYLKRLCTWKCSDCPMYRVCVYLDNDTSRLNDYYKERVKAEYDNANK